VDNLVGDSPDNPEPGTGTVLKKSQGIYFVRHDGQVLPCAISSKLRKQLIYPTSAPTAPGRKGRRVVAVKDIAAVDPVAVGDVVGYLDAGDGTGLITAVLPRRNQIARPAAGRKPLDQIIAANVDQIVAVMAAAQPAPKWELLDRYIAAAELAGIPTLVCVTKIDLITAGALAGEVDVYRRLGYTVLLNSTLTGVGIETVRNALKDRVSVMVGKSGVGKTSLLNALQPGLGLRVNAVSQLTEKGKHTTSQLEMFDLDFGGHIVDTPGMREFGLSGLDELDLAYGFVEMRPYLGLCKFGADCEHDREPGCAIRSAVATGAISDRRYESYLRMRAD